MAPLCRPAALAALAAALLCAAPARAQLAAERLGAGNLERLRPRGPDAVAGLGDFALSNGTLCAAVSDPAHENDLSTTGGALMDLGHCGEADDQFLIFEQLVNLSTRSLVPVESVTPEVDAQQARVVARGARDGVALETRYALDLSDPTRLRVSSRLERRAAGERLFALGSAFAGVYSLTPFTLDTRAPEASRGFAQLPFFGLGRQAVASAAVPADLLVLVGDDFLAGGIAYAVRPLGARLERASGERVELPRLLLADELASVFAVIARPFWIGDGRAFGTLQQLQTRFMDLAVGDALVVDQEIWVGTRGDMASATRELFRAEPRVYGSVDDAQASLAVVRAEGGAAGQVRPGADGRFELRLPRGR
jgi:hypothetical protein